VTAARRVPALVFALALAGPGPARAQTGPGSDPMAGMSGMDHGAMAGMVMNSPQVGMAGVSGARGFYPFQRDSSGTGWQPDATPRQGLRLPAGAWLFVVGGDLLAGYAQQDGPHAAAEGFAAGVLSAAARRDLDNMDVFQLRARISPDTAAALIFAGPRERQPAVAVAQELSASYSHRLDITDTVFAYAGAVGQPAFGPPLYVDRQSAGGSPLAPILVRRPDAMEAAAGVVTGGWAHGGWKLEGSSFNGRAPAPGRLAALALALDSWAVRLSLNPAQSWALQASWAALKSPLAIPPEDNPTRWSASALYTRPWGARGWWSTTAVIDRTLAGGPAKALDAWLLESAVSDGSPWTAFARAEQADLRDLALLSGPAQAVRKLSLGALHDWRAGEHVRLGLGALYALGQPSPALRAAYGDSPDGAMVFLRLKLG
jgi:hypothetical protein